jgi:hypothetical protein
MVSVCMNCCGIEKCCILHEVCLFLYVFYKPYNKAAATPVNIINRLVFLIETERVLFEVRIEILCLILMKGSPT